MNAHTRPCNSQTGAVLRVRSAGVQEDASVSFVTDFMHDGETYIPHLSVLLKASHFESYCPGFASKTTHFHGTKRK